MTAITNYAAVGHRQTRPLMYALFNYAFCAVFLLPTPLYWNYLPVHLIFIAVCFLVATWNGAGFYIMVFARYEKLRREQKEAAEASKKAAE
mmetsp:Transcript_38679/g.94704  ORF Transcript_38679/g.94704 Transcript_38679/m.94704 type:complete len:91 (-) Transcript_38679:30-302(-)